MGFVSRVYRWAERQISRIPNIEPIVLAVLALATASLWGFIEIAGDVLEGDTQSFDRWVVRSMRNAENVAEPIGPPWVEEMGRDATALGGLAWLSFTTFVVAIFLLLNNKLHMMYFTLVATISGALMSLALKGLFSRPASRYRATPIACLH